jgi:fructose-bisphosphate aldolase class 1
MIIAILSSLPPARNSWFRAMWSFGRLFTAKDVEKYLSAVILDPETVYQKADNGMTFPELLTSKGIVPGVKPHRKCKEK